MIYARIVAVLPEEDGLTMGRVRGGGALTKVPLNLVTEARPGDTVLVCDGVAIGTVRGAQDEKADYVSGNPR